MTTPLQQWYSELLSVYERLGYPHGLVTHWALPLRDLETLAAEISAAQPTNVLEVGTFIGVATLAMCKSTPSGTRISTVDPDQPLRVELSAMNTESGGADLTAHPQTIAAKAAELLGVREKINFHRGGFAVSDTFASLKSSPVDVVPIVGPRVCEEFGPFDFVFVDGLHYEHAVAADLRLAARHLQPNGKIVVHDAIGGWGSNVRRAVYRFLEHDESFSLRHGRYRDLYDGIAVLERGGGHVEHVDEVSVLRNEEFLANLAAVLVRTLQPHRVLHVGSSSARLQKHLAAFGVAEQTRRDWTDRDLGGSFDLTICLGDVDLVPPQERGEFVRRLTESCDNILFGTTPPGEVDFAKRYSTPVAVWVKEFLKHGYLFEDSVRPTLEPLRFSFSFKPTYKVVGSELLNLHLIRRRTASNANLDASVLIDALVEKERRIEDLSLQGVFLDVAVGDTLQKWASSSRAVGEGQEKIADQSTHIAKLEQELAQAQQRDERDQIASLITISKQIESALHGVESTVETLTEVDDRGFSGLRAGMSEVRVQNEQEIRQLARSEERVEHKLDSLAGAIEELRRVLDPIAASLEATTNGKREGARGGDQLLVDRLTAKPRLRSLLAWFLGVRNGTR